MGRLNTKNKNRTEKWENIFCKESQFKKIIFNLSKQKQHRGINGQISFPSMPFRTNLHWMKTKNMQTAMKKNDRLILSS